LEASLHQKALVVEEESPKSDIVANVELPGGHVGEHHVPEHGLKEKVRGDFDEVEHIFKIN
jgi:hypothetical protein